MSLITGSDQSLLLKSLILNHVKAPLVTGIGHWIRSLLASKNILGQGLPHHWVQGQAHISVQCRSYLRF